MPLSGDLVFSSLKVTPHLLLASVGYLGPLVETAVFWLVVDDSSPPNLNFVMSLVFDFSLSSEALFDSFL